MSSVENNRYWIPNLDINRKAITQEIQYYLGPESTVRPYTRDGEDGFLITTPGECLTDEQIDDICCKSREVWEKQAEQRSRKASDQQLKRPMHQPVIISRGSKSEYRRHRRLPEEHADFRLRDYRSRRSCEDKSRLYDETSTSRVKASLEWPSPYILPSGQPDMNQPLVLQRFTALVEFRGDTTKTDIKFLGSDHSMQSLLHLLARQLSLEYEYFLASQCVRISRPCSLDPMDELVATAPSNAINSLELDMNEALDLSDWIEDYDSNNSSTLLPDSYDQELSDAPELLDSSFIEDEINSMFPDIFSDDFGLGAQLDQHLSHLPECDFDVSGTVHGQRTPQKESEWADSTFQLHDQENNGICPTPYTSTPILGSMILTGHQSVFSGAEPPMASTSGAHLLDPDSTASEESRSRTIGLIQQKNVSTKVPTDKAPVSCWKCKVLRKKCDSGEPCQECLKGGSGSTWQSVGCKRGPLSDHVKTSSLRIHGQSSWPMQSYNSPFIEAGLTGRYCDHLTQNSLPELPELPNSWIDLSQELDRSVWQCFSSDFPIHQIRLFFLSLDQLSEILPDYSVLLERAKKCFFSCTKLGHLDFLSSQNTVATTDCSFGIVSTFEKQLKENIDELSRILFKKKNLRGDKSWWLPTFCTLFVHGIIRKILLKRVAVEDAGTSPLQDYLYLAVRLFGAISREYDPLTQNEQALDSLEDNIWKAAGGEFWERDGIRSSTAFLKSLYDFHANIDGPIVPQLC